MSLIFDLIRYQGVIPYHGLMGFIYWFTQIIGLVFMLMYFHQGIYLIVGTLKHHKLKDKQFKFHTIGIVISARNESKVIGELIKSIRANDYPQAMTRIFVVADNCTDNTAQICRDLGCEVFERFNKEKVGKGYALNYLFTKLHTEPEWADKVPEAYIILDADNIIKPNFITEMNKAYDYGYEIVTSYRNSKNIGKNWITAGTGYWFLHEARHLNNARMMFNNCCTILGTGFLISSAVVKEYNNWEFFMLTEDAQCSSEYALSGRKIGYNSQAELYDEQPETFKQSWRQRERWCKGYYQVIGKYGTKLVGKSFKNFSCWDVLTTIFPALVVTMSVICVLPICSIIGLIMGQMGTAWYAIQSMFVTLGSIAGLMFLIALLVCITEWKKIQTSNWKKILYVFTFPLYMLTYIPIAFISMFKKVEWKPIVHNAKMSLDDIQQDKK